MVVVMVTVMVHLIRKVPVVTMKKQKHAYQSGAAMDVFSLDDLQMMERQALVRQAKAIAVRCQ